MLRGLRADFNFEAKDLPWPQSVLPCQQDAIACPSNEGMVILTGTMLWIG